MQCQCEINIRVFNNYEELLKSHFECFVACNCICIFFLSEQEETLHKPGYCYFTSQFVQSISLAYGRKRLKGKEPWSFSVFPLLCCHCQLKWLVNAGEWQECLWYERSVWLFLFLETCLISACAVDSGLERKAWPLVAVSTHPPAHQLLWHIYLELAESCWTGCAVSLPKPCLWGLANTVHESRVARNGGHSY